MSKNILRKMASLLGVVALMAQLSAPLALAQGAGAASLSLGTATLRNGCAGSIPITMNTGGESVWAADTAMSVSGPATINSLSLGSPLPMQSCNDGTGPDIMLCGARQAGTSPYTGTGTYGTINLTPSAVGDVSFTFDLGGTQIVNDEIENVLGAANGRTYTVVARYNTEVNGVGFCNPDTSAPIIGVTPSNGTNNASPNTTVTLALSDNRVGVDTATIAMTVNGVTVDTSGFTATGGVYTPPSAFNLGANIPVTAAACDLEGNCRNYTGSFRITPPPPPPTCGDSIVDAGEECDEGGQTATCDRDCSFVTCGDGTINDIAGEQCDDGNSTDNDGCSSSCVLQWLSDVPAPAPAPVDCPVCPTCTVVDDEALDLREAAPEENFEEEDFQEVAEAAVEEEAQVNSVVKVELKPETTVEEQEVIDECITKFGEYGAIGDRDGDGLSDRAECYIDTDPENADTDGDTCFDGEEVNRFYTSPLDANDCSISDFISEKVLITDPKPDWILRSLDVSGSSPERSLTVGVSAFPALYKSMSPVKTSFKDLLAVIDREVDPENDVAAQQRVSDTTEAILTLQEKMEDLDSFLGKNVTIYSKIITDANRLKNLLNGGAAAVLAEADQMHSLYATLDSYKTKPIFLGEDDSLQEIGVGNGRTAGFEVATDQALTDGIYDLVATAGFADGGTKSSAPVRVIIDSTVEVATPKPQTLDGIPIADGNLVIQNGRPVLSGETVYGAQVFATWESLVLSSSIIADSTEGNFDVQAPQDLEKGQDHVVTLYAVTNTDQGRVRSESIKVNFHVEKTINYTLYYLLGGLALLGSAAYVSRRRAKKIDSISPEHRAKESELYEAFGAKHIAVDGEQGTTPKNHAEKEKEVQAAFKEAPEEAPEETPAETPEEMPTEAPTEDAPEQEAPTETPEPDSSEPSEEEPK